MYMQQYFVKLRKLFSQLYTVFVFLMPQHDNGGFLKIAQRRASISKFQDFKIHFHWGLQPRLIYIHGIFIGVRTLMGDGISHLSSYQLDKWEIVKIAQMT